jgi:hypothetical protein
MANIASNQHEREIGKVVSVTTISAKVELHAEEKSPVRSYPGGLSTVAQIGAYLLFPIGSGEHTVSVLTGAFEHEGYEPDAQGGMTLQLAKPRRTLSANLLGTLDGSGRFLRGITIYPTLETPALIPDQNQLRAILTEISSNDEKRSVKTVLIGISPIYERIEIGMSIDDLFSRPLAIIGNTGSGKSWSVASVIQRVNSCIGEKDKTLSKFIVLDINGEYSKAFAKDKSAREANKTYINGKKFTLPLWLFELQEFIKYFGASTATQIPILERVITFIREDSYDEKRANEQQIAGLKPKEIRRSLRQVDMAIEYVRKLKNCAQIVDGNYIGTKAKESFKNIRAIKKNWGDYVKGKYEATDETVRSSVKQLTETLIHKTDLLHYVDKKSPAPGEVKDPYDALPVELGNQITEFCEVFEPVLERIHENILIEAGLPTITADTPVMFDPGKLNNSDAFDLAISGMRGEERIKEYIATLRLRIRRMLQDKRWKVFREKWNQEPSDIIGELIGEGSDRSNFVIIDCSMLAYDVLPFFCGIIGRLLLEVRENAKPEDRTVQPWVLVLEEAHNYLKPRREGEDMGTTLSRESYERIAKEGRKFGLSLVVASQRPADVSETVLSQCANFVVHRIQNPTDIEYFKKILPSGSRDILDQVSILIPGEALLIGSATNVPCRVKVIAPHPEPQSDTSKPSEGWKAESNPFGWKEALSNLLKDFVEVKK